MIKLLLLSGIAFLGGIYFFVSLGGSVIRPYIDPILPIASKFIPLENYSLTRSSYLNRDAINKKKLLSMNEPYDYFFIGNSHIQRFDFEFFLPTLKIVNFGISGDTTKGVLNRLCKFKKNIKFTQVYLLIGYNDLKYRTVQEIKDNYKHILNCIQRETLLKDGITILSLFPVDPRRRLVNSKIKEVNVFLKKLSPVEGFRFLDFYHLFTDSKGQQKSHLFTRDRVHLNNQGYQVLTQVLLKSF